MHIEFQNFCTISKIIICVNNKNSQTHWSIKMANKSVQWGSKLCTIRKFITLGVSLNMLKTPENCFFFTENWHKRVLNLQNYQIKGPGLANSWWRLLFSSECKGIAMHNFFWDTLYIDTLYCRFSFESAGQYSALALELNISDSHVQILCWSFLGVNASVLGHCQTWRTL